jgi:hypothetical protein
MATVKLKAPKNAGTAVQVQNARTFPLDLNAAMIETEANSIDSDPNAKHDCQDGSATIAPTAAATAAVAKSKRRIENWKRGLAPSEGSLICRADL